MMVNHGRYNFQCIILTNTDDKANILTPQFNRTVYTDAQIDLKCLEVLLSMNYSPFTEYPLC